MPNHPQAVILVAGKSTRTYPLTISKPKPLLPIVNKPILAHNLDQMVGLIDEAILIVGFCKEMIQNYFGNEYRGIKLIYVEQKEQLGSGHAIRQAEPFIKDRFVMLVGDDLSSRKDIESVLQYRNCVVGKEVTNPQVFGVLLHKDGILEKIVEKPKDFIGNLASIGIHTFDRQIFEFLKQIPLSSRGEYEATDAINMLAKKEKVYCIKVEGYWLPIGYPWELLNANEYLLQFIKRDFQGTVESNVTIKGEVVIGKGSVVQSGAYIQGPAIIGENCLIGPASQIRGSSSIGNNVIIGHGVEIKNSIIMKNTVVNHWSYLGDSIIGENVNIGAGSISANLRHDGQNVKSVVKSVLVDTGRKKFGTVIGDRAKIGIHTSIYPGRKIWPDTITMPSDNIQYDVMNNDILSKCR